MSSLKSFSKLHIMAPIRELNVLLIHFNKNISIMNRPILSTPLVKLSLHLIVDIKHANNENLTWEKRAANLENLFDDLDEIEEYIKILKEVEGIPVKKESRIGSLLSNIRSQAAKWLAYMRSE